MSKETATSGYVHVGDVDLTDHGKHTVTTTDSGITWVPVRPKPTPTVHPRPPVPKIPIPTPPPSKHSIAMRIFTALMRFVRRKT